jgi:hypothetical protein
MRSELFPNTLAQTHGPDPAGGQDSLMHAPRRFSLPDSGSQIVKQLLIAHEGGFTEMRRCLPIIEEKKSELLETSLIYLLSAGVAVVGFLLAWLICVLAGFGRS